MSMRTEYTEVNLEGIAREERDKKKAVDEPLGAGAAWQRRGREQCGQALKRSCSREAGVHRYAVINSLIRLVRLSAAGLEEGCNGP